MMWTLLHWLIVAGAAEKLSSEFTLDRRVSADTRYLAVIQIWEHHYIAVHIYDSSQSNIIIRYR